MTDDGIRDDELEAGLGEAFRPREGESVLGAIERVHGVGSSIFLREAGEDRSPVLLGGAEATTPPDDSRYQVLGEIARGGIGIVYQGRDKDLNRDIALKVLRPEYADREDVIQRFVEEAQVGGQLQHPGIVPVYGLGLQPDGRPSFAMKLIRGQTLAELLHSNAPGVDLIAVFEQVVQTMAYAHSRGVIHRDLKPANVMVGAFGEVQVVDWGFAKVLGQPDVAPRPMETIVTTRRGSGEGSESLLGDVMGTPAYMPPEQALGRLDDVDQCADVFALGAILCEILTGDAPYTGAPRDQLIAAAQCLLDGAFERLDAAEAADELKQLVRDCLKPLTADRPHNATVVAERLSDHFATVEERIRKSELDAVAAETDAAAERRGRRRALVLWSIGLVAVLIGAGGYLAWSGVREERESRATSMIAEAIREATTHEGVEAWEAAVGRAQAAVDIAASEGVDDAEARTLLGRLRRRRVEADEIARLEADDDAFLAELEEIRARLGRGGVQKSEAAAIESEPGSMPMVATASLGSEAEYRAMDAAYVAAFEARFGSVEASRERLAASRHAGDFAAILGSWARLRRGRKPTTGPDWRVLDRLVREIDPDNTDVRDALVARDVDALIALGRSRGDGLPLALVSEISSVLLKSERATGETRAFLTRQHRRAPGDFWVNWLLGRAADQAGDFPASVRHYSAAVAARPRHAMGWTYLGYALSRTGDARNAIPAARRGVELNPGNAETLRILGVVLNNTGDVAGSIAAYRGALGLNPAHGLARGHLIDSLVYSGDLDGATAVAREAIEVDRANAAAHFSNLGLALVRVGERDRALAAHRKAIELDPEFDQAHANLGGLLSEKGDFPGALTAYQRAVELSPENPWYHNSVGFVFGNLGDSEGAIAAFRRSLELRPDAHGTHFNVGLLLARKGDYARGLAAARRAVELAPGEPSYQELADAIERQIRMKELAARVAAGETIDLTNPDRVAISYELREMGLFAKSAEMFAPAFAAGTIDLNEGFFAACSAAMAGGEWLDDAVIWLRRDLELQREELATYPYDVLRDLRDWQKEPQLAAIRDAEDLSDDARKLWADVATLLKRAEERVK